MPKYEMFRVFRCQCFYKENTHHKDKFKPRAHKVVFLGFLTSQKGWNVLNLDTKEITVSRDVIFQEETFPFAAIRRDTSKVSEDKMEEAVMPGIVVEDKKNSSRCKRDHKRLSWLKDYVSVVTNTAEIPIIQQKQNDSSHTAFMSTIVAMVEPNSFSEVNGDPHWQKSMQDELKALEDNHTWEITQLLKGKRPIASK